MTHVIFKSLVGVLVILWANHAAAQSAEVFLECRADFSVMGAGIMTVQLTKTNQGALQARMNGVVSNPNVKPDQYQIRENINLEIDPYSREFGAYNFAETALVHLHNFINIDKDDMLKISEEDMKKMSKEELAARRTLLDSFKIPFDLKHVRKMTIYDLIGKQDKFGGTVLLEAYSLDGKFLGRLFRSIFVSGCS